MKFLLLFVFMLFPVAAFGQTDLYGQEPAGIGGMIWSIIQMVAPVVMGSSLITAFFSSKGGPVRTWIMRIVDFLAINWMKARNDPAAQ